MTTVIVCCGKADVDAAHKALNGWWYWNDGEKCLPQPHCWQPLPEPPEDT